MTSIYIYIQGVSNFPPPNTSGTTIDTEIRDSQARTET